MTSYVAQVKNWNAKVRRNHLLVLKIAGQNLFATAQRPVGKGGNMPIDTGFLRNSLIGNLNGSTMMTGPDAYVAAIAGMEEGDEAFVGWTADYARHVHDGARGRAPRLFLDLELQMWQSYVDDAAREVSAL